MQSNDFDLFRSCSCLFKVRQKFFFSPLFTKFMVYLIIIQVGQFNCKLCKIIIILILKRIAIYYAI